MGGTWRVVVTKKMNGKKSKSKKFIYNFIYKKATSAQPNVDQALSGESKNKKLLDYGKMFT